jgi:hypothetical protein
MLIEGYRVTLRCLAVFAFAVRTSNALCSVPQPRSLCAEYFHSDAVVTASLIKVREVGDFEGHF